MRDLRIPAFAAALFVLCTACSRDKTTDNASAGNVDLTTAAVSATGPGAQVTRTDAASVRDATQYKLTEENFAKFMRAADSIAALESRDSAVRAHLNQPLTDAGSTDADAGLKWLESDTAASNVISAAGLSPRDYFVMAIAIAGAEQHLANPNAAPPTPAARDNAEFLRGKTAELARLHTMERGKPGVVVTP